MRRLFRKAIPSNRGGIRRVILYFRWQWADECHPFLGVFDDNGRGAEADFSVSASAHVFKDSAEVRVANRSSFKLRVNTEPLEQSLKIESRGGTVIDDCSGTEQRLLEFFDRRHRRMRSTFAHHHADTDAADGNSIFVG